MICSFHNVDIGFYQQFVGENFDVPFMRVTTHKNELVDIPVRFVKKSAKDWTEESTEQYPVVSIQNYMPKVIPTYYYPEQTYFANVRDTDSDTLLDTITEYTEPIPFKFKYEVNIACKSESEWDALKMEFVRRFYTTKQSNFVINKNVVPLDGNLGGNIDVGDAVGYIVEDMDISRSDGIFETMYTFTITAWVYVVAPVDLEIAQSVGIRFNVVDFYTRQPTLVATLNIEPNE